MFKPSVIYKVRFISVKTYRLLVKIQDFQKLSERLILSDSHLDPPDCFEISPYLTVISSIPL